MSEQDFDARLTHIEEQAEAKQERVDAYRDQEMGKLFDESGWSQEELAAHLSKRWDRNVSPDWAAKRLRFGRFIAFFNTTGIEEYSLPPNLTERAFRRFWEATEPSGNWSGHKAKTEAAKEDERRRFALVLTELKNGYLTRKRKPIKAAIVKKLADREKWLTAEQVAEKINQEFEMPVPPGDVVECFKNWKTTDKFPYRIEKAGAGEMTRYRVMKATGRASKKQVQRWAHDLIPMLNRLIAEAQKDRVEISLSTLCHTASAIKQVLEHLTVEVPMEQAEK